MHWLSPPLQERLYDDLLKANNLDAICGPTNGPACCIDLVNGDYDNGVSLSSPAAMAGYPHITVPMGFVHQLPVGFSFFSTAYDEPKIIALAMHLSKLASRGKHRSIWQVLVKHSNNTRFK